MDPSELTVAQCRVIAAVRARSPKADVIVHPARGGVILEVRAGHRVELARLDIFGRLKPDRHVRSALRPAEPLHASPQAA